MLHIKLEDFQMQQLGRKYFAGRTPTWPCGWGKVCTVLEHGHVAYQIKWNQECSNMKAHVLSLQTPVTPGVESKVKTFFFF